MGSVQNHLRFLPGQKMPTSCRKNYFNFGVGPMKKLIGWLCGEACSHRPCLVWSQSDFFFKQTPAMFIVSWSTWHFSVQRTNPILSNHSTSEWILIMIFVQFLYVFVRCFILFPCRTRTFPQTDIETCFAGCYKCFCCLPKYMFL